MNIEFHTPHGQVKENLINYVKEKLMGFYHRNKNLSAAEVYFREQAGEEGNGKICEINLSMPGDTLFVHRKADHYEQAARDVISDLEKKIEKLIKDQNEPPDTITSTVKV